MQQVARITALVAGLATLTGCRPAPDNIAISSVVAESIRGQLESGAGESSGSGEVAVQNPTGWATIRGLVKLSGQAPARSPLALSGADAPICSANGQLMSEEVLVGGNNELKNVLLLVSSEIRKEPGWVHDDYANTPPLLDEKSGFDQKNCVFLSRVFAMQASQTVRIYNSDNLGHNTKIAGGEGRGGQAAQAFNQLVAAGTSIDYSPGGACNLPMAVSCNIHPWMGAYMMVVDHPYFQVTGDDGVYVLANVPAGVDLELRAWHESKCSFSDSDGEWKKGRKLVKLEPGQELQLDLTVSLE